MSSTLEERAEQIVDLVRPAHVTRAQAVNLIAAQLRVAWQEGMVRGTETTGQMIDRIMDASFGKPRTVNDEVQRDYDEEREHGWAAEGSR